jgi:hypothetical protein
LNTTAPFDDASADFASLFIAAPSLRNRDPTSGTVRGRRAGRNMTIKSSVGAARIGRNRTVMGMNDWRR